MKNIDILETAFNALSLDDKLRLKKHLEDKTPVFCGVEEAEHTFFSEEGFA